MLAKSYSATVTGLEAVPVTIEVDSKPKNKQSGIAMTIVGLPDSSVKESSSRISAALTNSGLPICPQEITINLAPGDIRKEGTGFDLPIAIGILSANGFMGGFTLSSQYMIVGELSLDGSIQPIRGALPIAIKARQLGYEGLILPQANAHEAAVVNRLKVYGAQTLQQVTAFCGGKTDALTPLEVDTRAEFKAQQGMNELDFADVSIFYTNMINEGKTLKYAS